jgi:hypothetical protein
MLLLSLRLFLLLLLGVDWAFDTFEGSSPSSGALASTEVVWRGPEGFDLAARTHAPPFGISPAPTACAPRPVPLPQGLAGPFPFVSAARLAYLFQSMQC